MAARRGRKGDNVIVTWLDAVTSEEVDPGESLLPLVVRTTGWVWESTLDFITVVAEFLPDGRARGVTTIPRGMVLKITRAADE